jgi:hypothetical protein
MHSPASDPLIEQVLATLQQARVHRLSSERAEIASRIANFRAHQERFRLERDAFYQSARERMRSELRDGASHRESRREEPAPVRFSYSVSG